MMPENSVFVLIDFAGSRDDLASALEQERMGTATEISERTLAIQDAIKQMAKAVGGKVVFESGINLMLWVPYDEELIDGFNGTYEHYVGEPTNIGVGKTPIEAYDSVSVVGSLETGFIVKFAGIKEDLEFNRKFYREADGGKDLKVAEKIKSALLELKVISSEVKVFDIFMRLIRANQLDTVEDIQSFFYKPLEELKIDIREVYKRQEITGAMYGEKSQTAPGQTEINRSPRQKSPHRRFNWLTREEYNDGVDYGKTDFQNVGGNQTKDSQEFSMGGEPGNAVYIP